MDPLSTSWGVVWLTRAPEDPREQLRAWDAADEYLLRHLAGETAATTTVAASGSVPLPTPGSPVDLSGTVVVLGDRWGALTTALAAHRPVLVTDSFLAREATVVNLRRAGVDPSAMRLLTTRELPPARVDVLLVRVPRSLALVEDQLHRLAPAVHAGTVVVGTGMTTEIHTSTLRLFERILGPTRTSLAVRKARLVLCAPDPALPRTASPWPLRYQLPEGIGVMSGRTVVNHAGVFCADRLDVGTRTLLAQLPSALGRFSDGRPLRVLDLGCGNGVLGTAAALADPRAQVVFTDESFQAVASAEATYRTNVPPTGPPAVFHTGDGADPVGTGEVDLVLNNPPFHSHRATSDAAARRMFTGARRVLRLGGELLVVGNRHLGHHVTLRRVFGNCETVASTPKFVVLRARRT